MEIYHQSFQYSQSNLFDYNEFILLLQSMWEFLLWGQAGRITCDNRLNIYSILTWVEFTFTLKNFILRRLTYEIYPTCLQGRSILHSVLRVDLLESICKSVYLF